MLEYSHKIDTHINYFKEYLGADIKSYEEFYIGFVSIFMAIGTLMTDE